MYSMKNIKTNSQTLRSSDKDYYPVFLDLKNRLCIVVGGGRVAERKTIILTRFGARVKVIAPSFTKRILNLEKKGKIELVKRGYKKEDLKGAFIVFAATDKKDINREIKKDANEMGILTNVVDDPEFCDFIVPSIIKRGPVTVAISTSGTLPMFAKMLKEKIGQVLTKDHIKYVKLIGSLRKIIINEVNDTKKRKKIINEIKKCKMDEIIEMNLSELKKRFLD